MSNIFEFMGTTATTSLLLVLNIIVLPQISAIGVTVGEVASVSVDVIAPSPAPVEIPDVIDADGNLVLLKASYSIHPANKIDGLSKDVRGVGVFYNNSCPFHASLSSISRCVKFKPDGTPDDDMVQETSGYRIAYESLPNKCVDETKEWEVVSEDDDEKANSPSYVYASAEDDSPHPWFQIRKVNGTTEKHVYKIQSCDNGDLSGSTCKDVNVVTTQTNVMVLAVGAGVPLHVLVIFVAFSL